MYGIHFDATSLHIGFYFDIKNLNALADEQNENQSYIISLFSRSIQLVFMCVYVYCRSFIHNF